MSSAYTRKMEIRNHLVAIAVTLFVCFSIFLSVDQITSYRRYVNEKDTWDEFQEFQTLKLRELEKMNDDLEYQKLSQNSPADNSWNEKKSDPVVYPWSGVTSSPKVEIPPKDNVALMGRYIVNQSNWTSVATISSNERILNYPFANVVAISDGLIGQGSGIPYMYLTPWDFTGKDIDKNNSATLMMTLAQGSYCVQNDMESIDPRCARIILSGNILKIRSDNVEQETARDAIFGRHPQLIHMPNIPNHKFYFAKLNISVIAVLDDYGGAKFITKDEYFKAPIPEPKINYREV